MKNELVILNVDQYGLQENKAKDIEKLYLPMIKMLSVMEAEFNDVVAREITPGVQIEAKSLRLKIARIRIDADKARKEGKAEYLRAGNAIQGAYNTLAYAVESKEQKLKDIELYFEKIRAEKIEKLAIERTKILSKYIDPGYIDEHLGSMSETVWDAYFSGTKLNHDNRIAAEKKAEKDRITKEKKAEAERIRIAKENAQLKKEVIRRERLAKIEAEKRAKIEKERQAKAEKERKEREEKERIDREKYESALKKEREEKAKIEAELKAKAEKEKAESLAKIKLEKELKAKEKASLLAPDKEKLLQLSNDILNLKFPEVISNDASGILENVQILLTKTSNYIKEKTENL